MKSKYVLPSLLLLLLCAFAKGQTTCGTNCDQTYNALSAQSNIDFNSIAPGGDGYRTVCLQGDQGGFDFASNLDFKTTSRLYICETNDAADINITGQLRFNGTVDIYVEGTSLWTDIQTMSNNVDITIEAGDTLELNESGTSTIAMGNDFDLVNNGTFIINDNLNGDRDDAVWTNNGDIYINGNITNWNFDLTMADTTYLEINGNVTSNTDGSLTSDGDVTINGNCSNMNMDFTMGDSTLLDINGTLDGNHSMVLTLDGELQVSGHVDQDFYVIINSTGRIEAYSDWDMEYTFENNGAWIVDGDLEMLGEGTSDFSGGYILSETLTWNGSNNFSASASNCGFLIFNTALGTTGSALTVTPDTLVSLVSTSTIDNSSGDYDEFDILENAGFTFPTPLTDTDKSDFVTSGFNDFINDNDCENHILPLTLLDFTANKGVDANDINWTISALQSFEKIELQRSYDGYSWTFIESFTPTYTSNASLQSFAYSDPSTSAVTYYRLVIIDQNDKNSYSHIVAVGSESIVPITSFTDNVLSVISHPESQFQINIYSSHGQLLRSASHVRSLNLNPLPNGVYVAKIGEFLTQKILVK